MFSILNHLDLLSHRLVRQSPSESRFLCPVCENDTLTILTRSNQSFEAGAYQCWAGCSCDDIRESLGVPKSKRSGYSSSRIRKPAKTIQLPRPPRLPEELSFISADPAKINFGVWDGTRKVTQYRYSTSQYVERIEWMEYSQNGLERNKTFRQYSNGSLGKGTEPWSMYQWDFISGSGNVVLLLEGEKSVDTSWQHRIAATCPQGSSYTDNDLLRYSSQFLDRRIVPLVIPDHDLAGERKLQKWVKAFSASGVFYSIARLPSFYGWQPTWDMHELLSVYPIHTLHRLYNEILPGMMPRRKQQTA